MFQQFSQLLGTIRLRVASPAKQRPHGKLKDRSLRLESLENRRVLATVTGFEPSPSGFSVQLSEAIDTSKLNLYDVQSGAAGAADVTLTGASTGNVKGSLVVDGTRLTFIATGGALPADTYTVTLRSAADGITDLADGGLLDGEFSGTFPSGNGTAGGNFTTTFSVAANQDRVVGLPDFSRGPTQSVQLPTGSGTALTGALPIQLSNSAGVTSVTLTLNYDPALLNITAVQLSSTAPSGAQVESNLSVPGVATISFFTLAPMTAGQANIVDIVASVPEGATYGSSQALRVSNVEVNAGALSARADSAVHVVAFPGDVNGNRRYDAEDARLMARVGVGLDTGFVFNETTTTPTASSPRLFPNVDPLILADVTGVDGISPLDASDVLRRVVGLSTPNIPALPNAQTPTDLTLSSTSVAGNQPVGTTVGTLATSDPDSGDTFTYSLVSGTGATDNASFTISGNTLRTAAVFNQATKPSYSIRVQTTDSTGRTFQKVFTITVTAATNTAPTAITLSASTVAESAAIGTTVGTLSTADANSGDTFTYSLVSGTGSTDNAAFTIVGNQLRTATALNFESKSIYNIRVRTTDSGGLTFERTLTITVTNVNEAPASVALSNTSIANNTTSGTTIGTLSTTDPDANNTFTYTLVSGTGSTDNASFSISGNTLRAATTINFDSKATYVVRVRSTDAGGLFTEQTFTITQTGSNTAPSGIALSSSTVAENAASGTNVGTLSTTDANSGDTFTYSLVSGSGDTDNASFTISGNQLVTAASFDFETKSSYTIRVRTTDAGGLTFERSLTINVTNVNETPTAIALSSSTIANNAVAGTAVGTLSTTDPDAASTFTYTLVSGTGSTDNASFSISGNTLQAATTISFASKSSYVVRVRSTDAGGLFTEQTFTITQSGTNAAPTAIALSANAVAENAATGTPVGTLSTTDPNSADTFTYSLVSGTGDTDNASFAISGNQIVTAASFNFETKSSYTVRVRTTDAGGLTFEQPLTITITNVNETPTAIGLSNTSIANNTAAGTAIGSLSTTDPDANNTFTYTLVSGTGSTNNASFSINGNTLQAASTINFDSQTTYVVRVRSTDAGGLFTEQSFTITQAGSNTAPSGIALSSNSVAENVASGTAVGTLSTTDTNSGDTFTYSLVSGTGDTDNASFTVSGNQIVTAAPLNFETKSSYTVRVRTTDSGGLTFEQPLTITVTNVNETPTAVALSSSTIADNAVAGTAVGTLSTTDPDASDTFTYTLVSGTGSTDNASFSISGNTLQAATTISFASKSSYVVRVRSTDAGGLFTEQTFTITESEVNTAPTALALGASTVAENAASGTPVGTLSTTDANTGDTFTYSLVSGTGDTDNASFAINGNQLVTSASFDFETKSSYTVRVRTTDAGGLTFEQPLTITVTNVNESPTAVALSNTSIADDTVPGTTVGTLSTTDPDSGDTVTYTLAAGTGDDDNELFAISGSALQAASTISFGTQSSYLVRVRSTDAGGLFTEQTFTITQTGSNTAPSAVALSPASIAENTVSGTSVGTLSTTDSNAGDTFVYSLVPGSGDVDNASFAVAGNQLITTASFDFEAKSEYTVRIRTTDAGGLTFEQPITITVTDVNEAATSLGLSNSTINDLDPSGTVVGSLTSNDPDAGDEITYSFVSGDGDSDNGSFTLSDDQLVTAFAADFTTKSTYTVRVRGLDGDNVGTEQTFTITVSDGNLAPTGIAFNSSIAENSPVGSLVGSFVTADPNPSDTFTYSLVSGTGDTDNASFTVSGDQLLTAAVLDFEMQDEYTIRVRTTDSGNLTFERTFTITLSDMNEAATTVSLSGLTVDDGDASGTVVGTLTSDDPDADDPATFTFASGDGDTDNASFTIENGQLVTAFAADFATKSSYSVRVRAEDGEALGAEQSFIVLVNDLNDAPTAITLDANSVSEDAAVGAVIGEFTSTDADASDTHTYSFVAGDGDDDNGSFTIVDNQLQTATTLDFETKSSYTVRVRTTDSGGATFDETFTINVTDVNEAATTLALSNTNITDGDLTGTVVGTFTSNDPDAGDVGGLTYSFASGTGDTDNASFTISGNQLVTDFDADLLTQSSYSVRVRVEDALGLGTEETFTIVVDEVNMAPTAIILSGNTIAEDADLGTDIGTFASTDANASDEHTYEFASGTGDDDNDSFVIVDNQLQTATTLDFETKDSYTIRVRSTDDGGLSFEETFTISVTDVNEAATTLSLNNTHITDGDVTGTVVGTFTSNDPDAGDVGAMTYSFASGDGDTDNGVFTISGDQLVTGFDANFLTKSSYSVRVLVEDGSGLGTEQTFTIVVDEVNTAPTAIALSADTIGEDATVGTEIGLFTSTDANASDTHSYDFASGDGDDDNGSFTIIGNQLLTATTLDFETKDSYTIRVRSTDSGNLTFEETFTITITDANDAPTAILLDNAIVDENVSNDTLVGMFSTSDADASDSATYTLVSGDGDDDNDSFSINVNELRTATTIDFETKDSYSIRVRSTDTAGAFVEFTMVINVANVNEAPTALAISRDMLASGEPTSSAIGLLATQDPDATDSFMYELVSGIGGDDNGSFTIDGSNHLVSAEVFDNLVKDSYTVRVRTTDAGGLTFEQPLTITITETNQAPSAIVLSNASVDVDSPAGTVVGLLSTTDSNATDDHTYELASGTGDTDNALFTIVDNELRVLGTIDSGTPTSLSIRVLSQDPYGLSVEQVFTITVNV